MLYKSTSIKRRPETRKEGEVERVVIINDQSVMSGGAACIALDSAVALQAAGIPVTFVSGDDGSEIDTQHDHIDFVSFGGMHILEDSRLRAAVNGIFNYKAYRFLSDWIKENDTDQTIYHVHGWSKILSPSIFLALKPVASRLAIHAHDHFLACPNGAYYDYRSKELCNRRPLSLSCLSCHCDRRSYAQKIWRSVRLGVCRFLLSSGQSQIVPVHKGMINLLAKGGISKERISVLGNPVTPWRGEPVTAKNNRNFLYVGRLEEDKGVRHLAEAAQKAGVKLHLVGSGSLAGEIGRDYPEVKQHGWKSQQEISNMCGSTRVVVMPSLCRETFGLVAFEALLSGIPVLVSDRAMIAEQVEKCGWGLVGNPEDKQQFAELLRRMASDDLFIEQASKRGVIDARQLAPSLKAYTNDLLALYNGLLQKSSTGVV